MAGMEENETAEKVAAAKKRVAQRQKAKKKAGTTPIGTEKSPVRESNEESIRSPGEETVVAAEPDDLERRQQGRDAALREQEEIALNAANTTSQSELSTIENVESPHSTQGDDTWQEESRGDSGSLHKAGRVKHGRQPSLSNQSRMRSDSFRKTSATGPLSPSATSGAPAPFSPNSDTMSDIYRRQALRVEDLERENKRLEKEATEGEARWRRTEAELEELREASGEGPAFAMNSRKVEEAETEKSKLQAEIATLQRQAQQRGHSQSVSKAMRSTSIPESSTGSSTSIKQDLESKTSIIADMELEISRLLGELSTKTTSCKTHSHEISSLQENLSTMQGKLRTVEAELVDSRKSLTRASEKAVKAGVDSTSYNTKVKALQRELTEASRSRDDAMKKTEHLDKKVEAMNKLHREAEARIASKLSAAEASGREGNMLKARLASAENENQKAREGNDRRRRHEVSGADDDALDELVEEERQRLEQRVRELESEVSDLKRGIWRERRKELQPNPESLDDGASITNDPGDFDEVDLSGTAPGSAKGKSSTLPNQPKHSSISTVINSGLAAFRGSPEYNSAGPKQDSLLRELDDSDPFDERAFAIAQHEEEAKKMVEHVREIKRKLRDSGGWRLDLVDARRSAAGMQETGLGEIFEV